MSYNDHQKRHDFVLLFDVRDGNPNGDPDADNYPRTDRETGQGLVTDVALKRKVRDYVHRYNQQRLFIQNTTYLNQLIQGGFREVGIEAPEVNIPDADADLIEWFGQHTSGDFDFDAPTLTYNGADQGQANIRRSLNSLLDEAGESDKQLRNRVTGLARKLADQSKGKTISNADRDHAQKILCRDYYDIRMFGAVLQTGLNAGQVRGPLQMTFARSLDRIAIQDHTTTRQARTTAARQETGGTEIGRKPTVNYGLYRAHGFYSPAFARETGASDKDLAILWEALTHLFDNERSASRGEMAVCGLYVFTHTNPRGDAPAHRLFKRVQVQKRPEITFPRELGHYSAAVPADGDVQDGVTFRRLVHEFDS